MQGDAAWKWEESLYESMEEAEVSSAKKKIMLFMPEST
jgi:hypothetical protein